MSRASLAILAACAIAGGVGLWALLRNGAADSGKPITEAVDRGPIVAAVTASTAGGSRSLTDRSRPVPFQLR